MLAQIPAPEYRSKRRLCYWKSPVLAAKSATATDLRLLISSRLEAIQSMRGIVSASSDLKAI